jgi:hypothetical protein
MGRKQRAGKRGRRPRGTAAFKRQRLENFSEIVNGGTVRMGREGICGRDGT